LWVPGSRAQGRLASHFKTGSAKPIMRSMKQFQSYPDLVIHRQIQILNGLNGGKHHLAGPIYPDFEAQGIARHWLGKEAVDECPPMPAPHQIDDLAEDFLYGGCLTAHFGHFTSEFIHRILPAVREFPTLRVLFVGTPGSTLKTLPGFMHEVFAYLGIQGRVFILNKPTRVRTLHVFAQQEWLAGPPPSPDYLEALLERQHMCLPLTQRSEQVLYVSRSKQAKGIAAELLLDDLFAAAGARIYYPEDHSLVDQLSTYLSHRRLLFSEGSALHSLQLLGRLDAEVTVLCRRPTTMGKDFITPRVPSLSYVQIGHRMVAWCTPSGLRATWAGLTFIHPQELARFCAANFPDWPLRDRVNALRTAVRQLHEGELNSLMAFLGRLTPLQRETQGKTLMDQLVALRRFNAQELTACQHLLRPAPGVTEGSSA